MHNEYEYLKNCVQADSFLKNWYLFGTYKFKTVW